MKRKTMINVLLFVILMVGIQNSVYSQEFCEECECEEGEEAEGEGTATEDAEFSADLEEGPGEMSMSEGDILGEEVGEEVGEEIGTEIGTELGTELLATSALDVIPVVGEVIQGAILLGTIIYEAFNVAEISIKAEDHALATTLSTGNFKMSLVPEFHAVAHDLNSGTDKFSSVIFLKKNIGSSDVRKYITENGWGSHIDQRLDATDLNDHMRYSFSTFAGSRASTVSGRPSIPYNYQRDIPNITLSKRGNELSYNYTHRWSHELPRTTYYQDNPIAGEQIRWVQGNWSDQVVHSGKVDIVLQRTRTEWHPSLNRYFTIVMREITIPPQNLSIEEHGDQIAMRIKNLDIPLGGNKSDIDKLAIVLKIRGSQNFIKQDDDSGKTIRVFPDNWDYTEPYSNFSRAIFEGTDDEINLPGFSDKYPVSKNQKPETKDFDLFTIPVVDYVARNSDASLTDIGFSGKTESGDCRTAGVLANNFPSIHTVSKSHFTNGTSHVTDVSPGKSHLLLELRSSTSGCFRNFSHIELHGYGGKRVVVEFTDYGSLSTSTKVKAYYTVNNSITQNNLICSSTRYNRPTIEDKRISIFRKNTRDLNFMTYEGIKDINYGSFAELLIENVPFQAGEIIDVKAYYADRDSYSRSTVKINAVSDNVISRAYYTIKNTENRNLTLSNPSSIGERDLSFTTTQNKWLIEHQSNGFYAIMHKDHKKVLGIVDGKVGMYDWEPGNNFLVWTVIPSGNQYKFLNAGTNSFLSRSNNLNSNRIGFNFSDGLALSLQKTNDIVPQIIDNSVYHIINRINDKSIARNVVGDVVLKTLQTTSSKQKQAISYAGCLSYYIKDRSSNNYLYQDDSRGEIYWSSRKTNFLMTKISTGSNYYSISKSQQYLQGVSAASDVLDIGNASNVNEDKYHFRLSNATLCGGANKISVGSNAARFYLDFQQQENPFQGWISRQWDVMPSNSLLDLTTTSSSFYGKFAQTTSASGTLISPPIEVTNDDLKLLFDFAVYQNLSSNQKGAEFKVSISNDNELTWKTKFDYAATRLSNEDEWYHNNEVDLGKYVGQCIKVRFSIDNGTRFQGKFSLDNIRVQRAGYIVPSASAKSTIVDMNTLDFILSPNPARDRFSLDFTLVNATNVQYTILGIDGREVQSQAKKFTSGKQVWSIATDQLANGMYLVKIHVMGSNQQSETKRLLINR
ncbi:T9SS type A sorting domain-containing protein [Aquimarina sp. 2201CG1-2-11]|uniref:T9SS type A sorting domain-containing protein n=1 Tax=Aquimarina discodermiae TaxID=3231043 RepID=UPI003463068D